MGTATRGQHRDDHQAGEHFGEREAASARWRGCIIRRERAATRGARARRAEGNAGARLAHSPRWSPRRRLRDPHDAGALPIHGVARGAPVLTISKLRAGEVRRASCGNARFVAGKSHSHLEGPRTRHVSRRGVRERRRVRCWSGLRGWPFRCRRWRRRRHSRERLRSAPAADRHARCSRPRASQRHQREHDQADGECRAALPAALHGTMRCAGRRCARSSTRRCVASRHRARSPRPRSAAARVCVAAFGAVGANAQPQAHRDHPQLAQSGKSGGTNRVRHRRRWRSRRRIPPADLRPPAGSLRRETAPRRGTRSAT